MHLRGFGGCYGNDPCGMVLWFIPFKRPDTHLKFSRALKTVFKPNLAKAGFILKVII